MLAPVKINLYLAVGTRRTDGFHNVETVMHTLAFGDELRVAPGAEKPSVFCEPSLGIPPEENLAYRAVTELARRLERSTGFEIAIEKSVPVGAGLGGGSSDAAAVLRELARTWGEDPGGASVLESAVSLGADVPFLLQGGCARTTGRGDVIAERLPPLSADVVLVWPGEPVITGAAYAAFGHMLMPPPPGAGSMVSAIRGGDIPAVASLLYNNLTEASMGLVPSVGDAIALLSGLPGVLGTGMTGSGSAVFGICTDADSAAEAASEAAGRGWWARATRTSPGQDEAGGWASS